jgi:hypothetical protein
MGRFMSADQFLHLAGFGLGLILVADVLIEGSAFFFKLLTGKFSLIKRRPGDRCPRPSPWESPLDKRTDLEAPMVVEEPLAEPRRDSHDRHPHRPITLVIAADGSRNLDIPEHAFDRIEEAA